MVLFTTEHNLIKKEYELTTRLKFEEEKEREMLSIFSENIRKAHQVFCGFISNQTHSHCIIYCIVNF